MEDKMTGEEVVVTGISGIFPKCISVQEFMENLFNKIDMVSDDPRWKVNEPDVPKYSGKVSGIEKFDCQFFKVGFQRAIVTDPMARKLMEQAYGAIFDSGNTPITLKGKVGVFIGSSYSDFASFTIYDLKTYSEFSVDGTSKAMIANRISYWMNAKGPSYCLDYSCVSSTVALEHAFNSIKTGECDAAIVGTCNMCIEHQLTKNLCRAGLLCLDGKTKCFDKNGDGYVRSDAVNVILLQRAKDAKRVYAEVYHTEGAYTLKGNDQFLPFRKSDELQNFLNDVYSKIDVDPKDVEYVEANGAALAESDRNEVEAIANVFAGDKTVKIGCVKSNMGNSEPASGLCSLTKLCLAYHKGQIPGNLHLQEPVETVKEGKVDIVTENTKFNRGYTALNNLSYTGANYHVVLKGHYKEKNLEKYNSNIPRIVLASGRQESCVNRILNDLKSKQVDAEEIALLHNIFERDIIGHTGRGYIILDTIDKTTVTISESTDYYSGVKPPLYFVFSGMGSQWAGMGKDLMRIPIFAAAIERCHKALQPKGINLVKVITEMDDKIFDNIPNAFVGIGAVQIGLTDILKELGVVPDFIIGHSLGEAGCAYQDDTLTPEEMILSIYSRGKAAEDAILIKGSMAAVGVGYKNLVKQCPPEIDIACHNSSESCTISGPADVMQDFVGDLKSRGIFAKTVSSANIAYHSRYMAHVGPDLLRRIKEIIRNPKLRSDKWISTSVPRGQWDTPAAKYSSAEYHTNNMLNPVLFEEVLGMIPDNAVLVEIAPHGLLQAILKRSLPNCTHIPLTRRGNTDGVKFLLEAIGQLYKAGFNPKVKALYPMVNFPVSTETPLLSHLVEWEHSELWPLIVGHTRVKTVSSSRNIVFSLNDDDYKYFKGYIRNGVNVLPEAALFAFVWETLAMYQETDFRTLSVVFMDIQFHGEIILPDEAPVKFTVMISKGNDTFEVTQKEQLIMSGLIKAVKNLRLQKYIGVCDERDEFETDIKLTAQDIYRIMKMRGFDCSGKFQSIVSSNIDHTKALIKWTEHWIPFLDSLIQLSTISRDNKGISKPKFIGSLKISVGEHKQENYETFNGFKCYNAEINNTFGIIRCAGIEIKDIVYTDIALEDYTTDILESQNFFPFYPTEEVKMNTALEVNLQIITENAKFKETMITKIINETVPEEFDLIDQLVDKVLSTDTEIRTLKFNVDTFVNEIEMNEESKTNVILIENLLQNAQVMKNLQNISKDTFILSLEDQVPQTQLLRNFFTILCCMSDGKKILILMQRLKESNKINTCYIPMRFDDTFMWVSDVYSKLVTTKRVVLVSERQPYCGAMGFVKKLQASGHNNISIVVIDDFNAPKFDPDNDLYKEQLEKNMTINILRKGQWGSFYFKSVELTQTLKNFALKNLVPDNVENVTWVEVPKISGEKILAQVCYSGLSIYDCHKTIDCNISDNSLLGMDFSGIDKNGDKVMGLIAGGSAASSVEADPDLFWPVPDCWTLEDAATVPLAYVQAYYTLTIRSNIWKNKSILVCDGLSSVGQAIISLCLSYQCTVYATVDSEGKKAILLKLYPQLDENNVTCSDSDSFFNFIMMETKGEGCDFVINFAEGICRKAAAECVGSFGVFLDFSKQDMYENTAIGMSFLNRDRSYKPVDICNIFKPEYSSDRKILQRLIIDGIQSGVVKPLSRVVFSPLEVSKAFSVLPSNSMFGKVLIRVRDPSIISNGLEITPRISYSPQDVLVIICDDRGIGIELVDIFIKRGARKIMLHMKTSTVSGYFQTKLLTWSKQEVLVKLSTDNLQTDTGSATLMKNAMKLGTVKGILVVLDQKHTDNDKKEDFITAFKKQCVVVMNLDVASRNCTSLSQFIVLSCFSQSASNEYALSLTEGVCYMRNEIGLPALIVRYESVNELADYQSNKKKRKLQSLSALFNAIEISLKQNLSNVLSFNLKKEDKEEILSEIASEHKDKMHILFNHVEAEEDNVTANKFVEIPTPMSDGINNDWDPNDPYIILVPGFEGQPQIFESMAERLKMRAVSIQFGPDLQYKSVEEIAYNAREDLKRGLGENLSDVNIEDKKFFIMGYSFGVNIALELAALLEKEGKTGIVHCIDSSPDALQATIDAVLGKVTEDQLQNRVLNHMCNLITGKRDGRIQEDLKNILTFDAKVNVCLEKMKGVNTFSREYKKIILESACSRIVMAQKYKPQFKLKSQLVLMKNPKNLLADELPDDYNLSQYSMKPVNIFPLLPADVAKIPYDCRISNIVNTFIDTKTIDKFNNKNFCNVYTTIA